MEIKKVGIDKPLFYLSVTFTLMVCLIFSLFPEPSSTILDKIFAFCTQILGPIYLWVVLAAVLIIFFLSFSKYGNIKLVPVQKL